MTTFPTLDPELAAALTMLPKVDFADLRNARATYDALVGTMLADLSFDGVSLRELSAPGLDGDPEVTIRFFTPGQHCRPCPRSALDPWRRIRNRHRRIQRSILRRGGAGTRIRRCERGVPPRPPKPPFPGPRRRLLRRTPLHPRPCRGAGGVDPRRIAVGGQSAGGGLAAGTVLKARDEGVVPVAFQFLEIPELDDRLATVSMTNFVDTPLVAPP